MKESSSSNMDLYINERKTIKAKKVIIRVSCFTTSFSEIKLLIIYTHAKCARQFLLSLIFKSAGFLYGSNISILCFFLLFCVSNHESCRNHRLIILSFQFYLDFLKMVAHIFIPCIFLIKISKGI